MRHLTFLVIGLFLCQAAIAKEEREKEALIVTSHMKVPAKNNPNAFIEFFPAEVVLAEETKGDSIFVTKYDDYLSQGWISKSKTVSQSSFKPIGSWHGAKDFEVISESADSGQSYSFGENGTFQAKFDDNHAPWSWSGKLYQYGPIIWARPNKRPHFDSWNIFLKNRDGQICNVVVQANKCTCTSLTQEKSYPCL